MKIREISAVVSSATPICAMMMAVAPSSRTSPVAVTKRRAISSQCGSLLKASVRNSHERRSDQQGPVLAAAIQDHVAPVAGPVLAELFLGQQPLDGRRALVGRGVQRKRGDLLGRGRMAHQVQRHAAKERLVVGAGRRLVRRALGSAEHFLGQQLVGALGRRLRIEPRSPGGLCDEQAARTDAGKPIARKRPIAWKVLCKRIETSLPTYRFSDCPAAFCHTVGSACRLNTGSRELVPKRELCRIRVLDRRNLDPAES